MREILTYENFFTNLKNKFLPKKPKEINIEEIKTIIKDGLLELEDAGFKILIEDRKTKLVGGGSGGPIEFSGDYRSVMCVSIEKVDKNPERLDLNNFDLNNFVIHEVRDSILTVLDLIKDKFEIIGSIYIKTQQYKRLLYGTVIKDGGRYEAIRYDELENSNIHYTDNFQISEINLVFNI